MEAVCAAPKVIKPLDKGCKILRRPPLEGVGHTRSGIHLAVPDLSETYSVLNHHPCTCNEMIAIHNRVCGAVPAPTPEGLDALRKASRMVTRCLPQTVPDDYGVLPSLYSGAKRRRYEEATRKLIELGLQQRDATITMFVKDEKILPSKVNPDPRAIQFRAATYCVEIARFLKPIEHHLYNLAGDGCGPIPTTRVVGKGLNQCDRAKLLKKKLAEFVTPVVVSLDMSRFDQHCSKELLEVEHSVYLACCPDPVFAQLLSWQLKNRCYTRNGWVYLTRGKRMSGDMNTALGNCVIMICMIIAFMKQLQIKHWDMFDDGDDCLLIIESSDLEQVLAEVKTTFLSFGHEAKIEKIAHTMSAVSWCQSSPIEWARGKWKFVRDPWKTMSCDLIGTKWKTSTSGRKRLLATIGLCELALNIGSPILQEYALALMRSSEGAKYYTNGDMFQQSIAIRAQKEAKAFGIKKRDSLMNALARLKPCPITWEARLSFSEAFNISIERQLDVEAALRGWKIQLDGDVFLPVSWCTTSWTNDRAYFPERYL